MLGTNPWVPRLVALATVRCASGPALILSELFWGLALQSHPTVAVLLPAAVLMVLWESRPMLPTPWPYLAGVAFAVAPAPTIVNAIQSRSLVVLDTGLPQPPANDDGSQGDTVPGYLVSLGGLVESVGASLAGLINDRVTPIAPIWHPLLVLGLIVSGVARAAQAYTLQEIASDAAPTGPNDRGYVIVWVSRER